MRLSSRVIAAPRRGFTLLEVILALAIFLFSIIALFGLMDIAATNAQEIVDQSRGTRLAESKMADFVAGVEALSGGANEGNFEEEPDWKWTAAVSGDTIPNLFRVTITVTRERQGLPPLEIRLSQMILDPLQRGGLTTGTTTTTTSSSSSSSGATTGGSIP